MEGYSESEVSIKDFAMKSLLDEKRLLDLNEIFHSKDVYLLKTIPDHPFIIGDNPIAVDNSTGPKHPVFSNLGLVCKGIEVYFPISSTLCIVFYCPSITLRSRVIVFKTMCTFLDNPNIRFNKKYIEGFNFSVQMLNAYKSGHALKLTDLQNITRMNSLQVLHASRFLYAEHDSFKIAQKMIKNNSKLKGRGRTMSFS